MSRNICLSLLLVGGLVGCGTSSDSGDSDIPPDWTNGVSTLSGAPKAGYVDGARGKARFYNPVTVAYGPDNMVYVADFDNDKIRVVDPTTGDATTLINQKNFSRPFAMAFDKAGTLWISTDNNTNGLAGHGLMTGTIWRVDRGQRTATMVIENIGRPRGIVPLSDGRLALSDYMHHVIEILDPATNKLITIAGTFDQKGMADGAGAAARFSTPYDMVLKDGQLLVADYDNNRLRNVTLDGTVTTMTGAGQGFADGAMSDARFNKPQGMAITTSGDVYVTDLGNFRVRKIVGNTVTTVAGDGKGGYVDSDNNLEAEFYGLEGMSLTPDGSELYVADGTRGDGTQPHNLIRVVNNNQ